MRSSLRKLVRLVIWGSLWMLSACQPAEPPAAPAPNLILIVIDSLRADHLGAYGYPRATSPNLDALAKNGVLFRHAFSPSSWTKPAIGSLFTSRHPSDHRAISVARPLDASIPTLAELLQSAGYQTVGVTGNFVHINHHSGMDRGYGSWLSHVVRLSENERGKVLWREQTPRGEVSLRAPEANELNREVAKRLPQKGEKPLFLYVHYMEPHASYDPREPHRAKFAKPGAFSDQPFFGTTDHLIELAAGKRTATTEERRHLIDLYDAEIHAVDAGVGELVQMLAKRGLLENAVVILVSDHGEAFGEHDSWFHSINLFGESLNIPLIVADLRTDPVLEAGRVDERIVDLLDVPTTLLSLARLEKSPGMLGRDLFGKEDLSREFVGELHPDPHFEDHVVPRDQRLSLLRWPWKTIVRRDGSAIHFDLAKDQREERPSPADAPASLSAAAKELAQQLDHRAMSGFEPGRETLDAKTEEGLRALGYLE